VGIAFLKGGAVEEGPDGSAPSADGDCVGGGGGPTDKIAFGEGPLEVAMPGRAVSSSPCVPGSVESAAIFGGSSSGRFFFRSMRRGLGMTGSGGSATASALTGGRTAGGGGALGFETGVFTISIDTGRLSALRLSLASRKSPLIQLNIATWNTAERPTLHKNARFEGRLVLFEEEMSSVPFDSSLRFAPGVGVATLLELFQQRTVKKIPLTFRSVLFVLQRQRRGLRSSASAFCQAALFSINYSFDKSKRDLQPETQKKRSASTRSFEQGARSAEGALCKVSSVIGN
jgi:hypothetical protein